jgi:hypothetical protein
MQARGKQRLLWGVGGAAAAEVLPLFVLERDVARKDEAVLRVFGHIGVARAVVQHQTVNEFGVHSALMAHVHDFDHMQVQRFVLLVFANGRHSVHHNFGQVIRQLLTQLQAGLQRVL